MCVSVDQETYPEKFCGRNHRSSDVQLSEGAEVHKSSSDSVLFPTPERRGWLSL
jgi:hypothetical protein